jgi:hypothetical protein
VGPLSIEEVLAEEAAAIHDLTDSTTKEIVDKLRKLASSEEVEDARADKDADERSGADEPRDWVDNRKAFYCLLNKLNRAALCCSGGGIRSATFCLGVIQALAMHKPSGPFPTAELAVSKQQDLFDKSNESLLSRFHYLSTVSGGGYIGSWLSAWRTRNSFPTVWQNLAARPDGPDVEPAEISWLRAYSSYLTPKVGLASADTWSAAAIYLRNLVLNWLIIVPAVAAVLLVLKLLITFSVVVARIQDSWLPALIAVLIGAALLIVAQAFTTRHRPTRRARPGADPSADPNNVYEKAYTLQDLVPALFSALFVTSALTSFVGAELAGGVAVYAAIGIGALIGIVIYAAGWIAGFPVKVRCKDFWMWALSGLVYGGLVGFGAHLYGVTMPYSGEGAHSIWTILVPVIFGVPWVLLSQLFAEMVFVGLVSYEIDSDSDREWLGRAAGWVVGSAVIWVLTTFITFAGGYFFIDVAYGQWLAPYIAPGGGVVGAVAAWLGKSATTPIKPRHETASPMTTAYNIGLTVAGPLFAALLVVGISVALDLLLLGSSLMEGLASRAFTTEFIVVWLLIGFGGAMFVAWVASRNVNINRFSIHALYRNRLVRAYLGATRQKRNPDKFTGFDADDNFPAQKLWPPKPLKDGLPNTFSLFHVVNITLNVVKTARLAWQQRKAESFTVSPLHSGAAYKGFRKSGEYAGGTKGDGITLGTAMAISGAAASPNMGYHSSPSTTLLFALFNVRLGWWLGNPGTEGEQTYKEEGPSTAVVPLAQETFGQTTDDKPWVYLSDGGHFENLGLYEMVRRRCRLIVAIDAGCDPDFQLEDLGNAVRKIFIDLGVRIEFQGLDQLMNHPRKKVIKEFENKKIPLPYYTIGTIHYAAADGVGCEDGYIVYLKPAIHNTSATEGAALRSYAAASPAFPHEPTADQWFTESQFESYRALGLDITKSVLKADPECGPEDKPKRLSALFAALAPTLHA